MFPEIAARGGVDDSCVLRSCRHSSPITLPEYLAMTGTQIGDGEPGLVAVLRLGSENAICPVRRHDQQRRRRRSRTRLVVGLPAGAHTGTSSVRRHPQPRDAAGTTESQRRRNST